ncbi:MAG: NAD+ synthase [Wenzhouxiangellaceae bacterium]|nr:NAD+ synthase [Wenzhouxiangellaceae bacterium]
MLKIALAQYDFEVGHVTANRDLIIELIGIARDRDGADLIVFPELALVGCPPEDLVLRPEFMRRTEEAFGEILSSARGIDVVLPWPRYEGGNRFSSAAWLRNGQVVGIYDKWHLYNHAAFDEQRYFASGHSAMVVELAGIKVGVVICEDTWTAECVGAAANAGADLVVSLNASPYDLDKHRDRGGMLRQRNAETGLPLIYLNCVGGQDELVFDGHSLAIDAAGDVSVPAPLCRSHLLTVGFNPANGGLAYFDWPEGETEELPVIYRVLKTGLRDYALKNRFRTLLLGLSGGIDSALCAALAADALGPEAVHAVMLPSRHTSELSLVLATEQIDLLGIHGDNIAIEPIFQASLQQLSTAFAGTRENIAEENLQARARGMLLMALSNKFGHLLLATGNKSELAVGYSTLYGDMCGGFSPLKDCLKDTVYRLAEWRNGISPAIPAGVINRPPSAELAPNQADRDTLPPYRLLDVIIEAYLEQDRPISEIVDSTGIEERTVRHVAGMVLSAEFKRRQGAPGPRITRKAFGRDRRYPMTSGWHDSAIKR